MSRSIPVAACLLLGALQTSHAESAAEHFESKIRPVLVEVCSRCHGGEKTSGDLRVDSRAALLRGGERGAAVVPGRPEQSLIVRAILREDPDLRMPPRRALPAHVVADFVEWVRMGAVWPETASVKGGGSVETRVHWAFVPVRDCEPPADCEGRSEQPIDRFIDAKRRAEGLEAVGLAGRRELIRRVTFDLTGLPPEPRDVEAFVRDESLDAFARLVDRLLASPRYGERWGRHWMDVARYADTAGDNADYPIPEIHLYRDWIIDSFNADMPYDLFVMEQLAGDILAREAPASNDCGPVVATGFLALSRRYATAPYELWHLTLEDSIETTGRAFLAMTLRCARCHDHKFDPVTTEDYYRLYGVFASTRYPYAGSEEFQSKGFGRRHFVPLVPPREADSVWRVLEERVAALRKQIESATNGETRGRLEAELRALERNGLPAGIQGAYAVSEGEPQDVHVQRQGDPGRPGILVKRGVPEFLGKGDLPRVPAAASGRLELARWIADARNPLTARVMVNRVWQHLFGKGLVATPSNFGRRGERPSHPELLDYLAARFVESGWSLKSLQRLIVLSRTYRLSSDWNEEAGRKDPENRWLWRHDRRRLDAESIRDSLLATSGQLDLSRPGRHPFPPIESWGWTQHNPYKATYPSRHRSVYLMTQRIQRHPFLGLFDGADTNHSTAARTSATVPLQALHLMNNALVHERARGLAERLLKEAQDAAERVDLAHRLAYSRPASDAEIERGASYLESCREELARSELSAVELDIEAWSSYARVLVAANEFIYVD